MKVRDLLYSIILGFVVIISLAIIYRNTSVLLLLITSFIGYAISAVSCIVRNSICKDTDSQNVHIIKYIIYIVLSALTISVGTTPVIYHNYSSKLNENIYDLELEARSLDADISNNMYIRETLDVTYSGIEKQIKKTEEELDKTTQDIATTKSQLNDIDSSSEVYKPIVSQLEGLEDNKNKLISSIELLEKQKEETQLDIDGIDSTISAMENNKEILENDINDILKNKKSLFSGILELLSILIIVTTSLNAKVIIENKSKGS